MQTHGSVVIGRSGAWPGAILLGLLLTAGASGADDAQRAAAERFRAYLTQFPDADADGDGALTQDEWLRHYAAREKAAFVRERVGRLKLLEDLPYAHVNGRALKLDLYLPTQAANPPLIVWVHGGGWHTGTKDWCIVRWLVDEGYALASVEYRLTGEAAFPAQIHDCKGAIRWLRARAAEYGYDPARIAAAGESAGGHLVALLGVSVGVDSLEGTVGGNPDQDSRVQAVVDFYGPTDFVRWVDRGIVSEAVEKLLGPPGAESSDAATLASPATHVTADDPPILILHGSKDPLVPVDQSTRLHELYQAAGLVSQLHIIPGVPHTGPQFADPTRQELIRTFLKGHLDTAKQP